MFHRNEHGASALEFALVLPILIMLIFGAFSVGIGYDRKLSISHAARDTARYGATLPFDSEDAPEDAWFANLRDRAVAASTGHVLANGADGTFVCVAYVQGSLVSGQLDLTDESRAVTYTGDGNSWTAASVTGDGGFCFEDGLGEVPAANADLQTRVQVVTARPMNFNAVLIPSQQITIRSTSVARYER